MRQCLERLSDLNCFKNVALLLENPGNFVSNAELNADAVLTIRNGSTTDMMNKVTPEGIVKHEVQEQSLKTCESERW